MGFLDGLKRADVFRDIPKDFTEQTVLGASVSMGCFVLVCWLFVNETLTFLTAETNLKFALEKPVSLSDAAPQLRINLDIDVLKIPCSVVSLDAQDVMGTNTRWIGSIKKRRLDSNGDVRKDEKGVVMIDDGKGDQLVQKGEGCNVQGFLLVNKVPGNFHVSAHQREELIGPFFEGKNLNVSHVIKSLWFGEQRTESPVAGTSSDPLQDVRHIMYSEKNELEPDHVDNAISFEYYIKVIPSVHKRRDGNDLSSYQQVAHNHQIKGRYRIPAIYFRYDMSPVMVQYVEESKTLEHFVVQLCAIIGGVVTVLGIINSFVHVSLKSFMNKTEGRARRRAPLG